MNEHNRLWLLRLTSLVFLVVCGSVTVMLARHRSSHAVLGPYSVPAAAALLLATAASVAALTSAVLPQRLMTRFDAWLQEGFQSFRIPVPQGTRRDGIFLLSLALASYVVIAFRLIDANAAPRDDQLDYLDKAADIRRTGGLAQLSRQLWNGTYEEKQVDAGNRHPLYTALLSLRPDFTTAKWFSFFLALLTIGLVWGATVRRSGWLIGGVAAVLLATNNTFQQSASIVACEILLVLWTLLAWFTIDRPADTPKTSGVTSPEPPTNCEGKRESTEPRRSRFNCVWRHESRSVYQCASVGGWLGLAYLTKASAVLLLVCFLVWSLSVRGLRRWSWLAVVSFAVVCSPLLVRNTRAFGDPLYSFNTRFLFADTFEQGLSRPFRGTRSEASDYVSHHSVGSILKRAASGLAWEGFIFLRSLAPATLGESRPLVGLVIGLLALLGTIQADRRLVLLATAWCALFYVFFAWYVPIASGDRFLAPIVPIVLLFAARGAMILMTSRSRPSPDRIARTIRFAALLWCVAAAVLSFKVR